MIAPPTLVGVVYSGSGQGDLRNDLSARANLSSAMGIQTEWATIRQVHGSRVLEASHPGDQGEADAIWTSTRGLPVAVFTADCLGVVLATGRAVGVAHAGWRGVLAGVVTNLFDEMTDAGYRPEQAAIGPGIGACCFEVGDEVADRFPASEKTTWGTRSVDLAAHVRGELPLGDVWIATHCTKHEAGWFSHRRDATESRMAAIAWI